jgi:hypothetical protein
MACACICAAKRARRANSSSWAVLPAPLKNLLSDVALPVSSHQCPTLHCTTCYERSTLFGAPQSERVQKLHMRSSTASCVSRHFAGLTSELRLAATFNIQHDVLLLDDLMPFQGRVSFSPHAPLLTGNKSQAKIKWNDADDPVTTLQNTAAGKRCTPKPMRDRQTRLA